MLIRLKDNSVVTLEPASISNYNIPYIPGATAFSAVTNSFSLVLQELKTELYTLQYYCSRFFESKELLISAEGAGIRSCTVISKPVLQSLKGLGKLHLLEEQFTLYWTEQAEYSCVFSEPGEYVMLDVFYSAGFLEAFTEAFPELNNILHSPKPKILHKNPAFIDRGMREIIRQVTVCPYDDMTSGFYLDIKVREYLFLMLQQVFKKKAAAYVFSSHDTERLIEARRILLEDLTRKPYTIAELSRAVGINEFKLKVGFRKLFGTGVFECLHDYRMEKARELLLTTDKPIKEICSLTGYPRITNFITAFRRTFGYTPGSLRRGN